jgi:hypothetical protein
MNPAAYEIIHSPARERVSELCFIGLMLMP